LTDDPKGPGCAGYDEPLVLIEQRAGAHVGGRPGAVSAAGSIEALYRASGEAWMTHVAMPVLLPCVFAGILISSII
jgi:hypothetical protein